MRRIARGLAAGAASALLATSVATARAGEVAGRPDVPRLGTCGSGSGGFLLPGTDGCLTLGGFVRAEGRWTPASPPLALAPAMSNATRPLAPAAGGAGHSTFGTSARLTADMRVPTELGPVRVFVSLRGRNGAATDRAAR